MTARTRICPKCRNNNLFYGASYPVEDGLVIHRRLRCKDCAHVWRTEERIDYVDRKRDVVHPLQILDLVALLSTTRRRTVMDIIQALLAEQRSQEPGGAVDSPPWAVKKF